SRSGELVVTGSPGAPIKAYMGTSHVLGKIWPRPPACGRNARFTMLHLLIGRPAAANSFCATAFFLFKAIRIKGDRSTAVALRIAQCRRQCSRLANAYQPCFRSQPTRGA